MHHLAFLILCMLMMINAFHNFVHYSRFGRRSSKISLFCSSHEKYTTDTIYALSSGPLLKSGVAVVRISGPQALYCLEQFKNPNSNNEFQSPQPRMAKLTTLFCPKTKETLDKGIILWFPKPNSFTGEDVVELHLHGSRAVVAGLFDALEYLNAHNKKRDGVSSIRMAEKGEFTKRAFEHGKMDLTEVEGLSDLLAADTARQRKQALLQMSGHLKEKYESWRSRLLTCMAHTEAVIDFGDDDREGDINDQALAPLLPVIKRLVHELESHLQDGKRGEIIREGVQIALVGQPNAGKSSLMNALARRPAAIVSPIAGTTRDIVEVRLDVEGVACIIRDTAGLRVNPSDEIEKEGIKRAKEALQEAHVRIFVLDSSDPSSFQEAAELFGKYMISNQNSNDEATSHSVSPSSSSTSSLSKARSILVFNKVDLQQQQLQQHKNALQPLLKDGATQFSISCVTGDGLETLEQGLASEVKSFFDTLSSDNSTSHDSQEVFITRERHRMHVQRCLEHLHAFLEKELPMDLAAEEIRLAMMELGKITGLVDTEEMLDIIFRDFCIGK